MSMYKLKPQFHDPEDDDYIVVERLTNVLCVQNCRTNHVSWISRHMFDKEFDTKETSKK